METLFANVAPLVGAWIEISNRICNAVLSLSLPLWERGLKSRDSRRFEWLSSVAPLVGAWIEIPHHPVLFQPIAVAPLVGAWIEISITSDPLARPFWSLPLWERGLKSPFYVVRRAPLGRSPCGSVD